MASTRFAPALTTLCLLLVACAPARTDNQALLPAGALAAELSQRLDASRLGENSPGELVDILNDAASVLPVGPTAQPEQTFPYLITVTSGEDAACVAPDFAAIAEKVPGPLEFSVTEGPCVLDAFTAGFQMIIDARQN